MFEKDGKYYVVAERCETEARVIDLEKETDLMMGLWTDVETVKFELML